MINWGESTFIQGGINVVNPVDVSRLRVAGAELKEAFLPINSIWPAVLPVLAPISLPVCIGGWGREGLPACLTPLPLLSAVSINALTRVTTSS